MSLSKKILKERKNGIGGSDCAAVFGKSRWDTPLDIYLDKIDDEIEEEKPEPEHFYWGNIHEPNILKRYEDVTGNKVTKRKGIIKSDKYPWLFANIDGIVEDKKIIVEAKSTRFFDGKWGYENTDKIPEEYLIQCAHYCLVLDIDIAHIAVLEGGNRFRTYIYERNKELDALIIKRTKFFWYENVQKEIPPGFIDSSEINKLFKRSDNDKSIIIDEKTSDVVDDFVLKRAELDELTKEVEELKNQVKAYMEDASLLLDESGSKLMSWNSHTRKTLDSKKIKVIHPDIYNEFMKTSTSRIFRTYI